MEAVQALAVPAVAHVSHDRTAENDGLSTRAQVAAGSGPYESTIPTAIAEYSPY